MTGTVGEVPIFLGAVYGGLVIGLTFTAFRVLHALFGGGRISDVLLDALFYLLSGVIAALTLFRINGGSLRLYALLGIAAGIFAVLRSVDPLLCGIVEKLQNLHGKITKKRL